MPEWGGCLRSADRQAATVSVGKLEFWIGDQAIEDAEHFAHDCGDGDFEGLAAFEQPLIKGFEDGVDAHATHCGHVENSSHLFASALDVALAAHRPAVS